MRTALEINDELLQRAERRAASSGTTLKIVVEEALRAHLPREPRKAGYRLRWRTERGEPTGVKIDDRRGLFDLWTNFWIPPGIRAQNPFKL